MTDFLYPFIDRDERNAGALLEDLASSAVAKAALSTTLRNTTIAALDAQLDTVAVAMVDRFRRGGQLHAFGNGGSSTDAAGAASLFGSPSEGQPLPARSLVADHAVLTALANDVGYDLVFARQLISMARAPDIAIGISTSGSSTNLLMAFAEARRLGLLTIGLAGYDGGTMKAAETLDHCLVVCSDSVHRIQETQSAIVFELWQRVQAILVEGEGHGR